ncbi:MAG: glycosyltransferase family A protein, partial [Calditrichota bacterium]
MIWLIGFIGIALLIVLGITLSNVLFAPMLKNAPSPGKTPTVSVLIPARNEEMNIGNCLTSLSAQTYPSLEIIVLDDQSSDKTTTIVQQHSLKDNRIRLIRGTPLKDGWTGKNWACHQLSKQASGNYLIFTDADTTHHPDAVRNSIGWMQARSLTLLSS